MKLPPRLLLTGLLLPTVAVAVWVIGGWPSTAEREKQAVEAMAEPASDVRHGPLPGDEAAVPLE